MKTIRVMIKASEEMHTEKVQFQSLINELNIFLEQNGLEIERIKWPPKQGDSIDEFMAELDKCEICINLFYQDLSENSEKEFDKAYEELLKGNNPKHLYIFFKEPAEKITDALKSFRDNIEDKYGHFYCRFENIDTLNLQFVLKFLATHSQLQDLQKPIVTICNRELRIGNSVIAKLDNIPFAALNKEYLRMRSEIFNLNQQVNNITERLATNQDDGLLKAELDKLTSKLYKLQKDFEKYQLHLYDIALNFEKIEEQHYSERIRHAKKEFEKGNVTLADKFLNMSEMKQEAEHTLKQQEQLSQNLRLQIEEFHTKAIIVMANTDITIPTRFETACEAYNEALKIAKFIQYDDTKLAEILFDYAYLLADFNHTSEAIIIFNDALNIFRRHNNANTDEYQIKIARTLYNIATGKSRMHNYTEAINDYNDSLLILRKVSENNPQIVLFDIASILCFLASAQQQEEQYTEAEKNYVDALDICSNIKTDDAEKDLLKARILNAYANLLTILKKHDEALANYKESLRIRQEAAERDPNLYNDIVADSCNNIGNLLCEMGDKALNHEYAEAKELYNKAEQNHRKALELYRFLAINNPDKYLPEFAIALGNLASCIGVDLSKYDETVKYYTKSIKILGELYQKDSSTYAPYLAGYHKNFGMFYEKMQQTEEAVANYKKALHFYKELDESLLNSEEMEKGKNFVKDALEYYSLI